MTKYFVTLLYIICIICIPLAAAEAGSPNKTLLESPCMDFAIKGYTFNAEIESGILICEGMEASEPGPVNIPDAVKEYNLVTFDQLSINTTLRSVPAESSQITFQINGTDYPADLYRMDFESIDDGIDSYTGTLAGVANSSVLLTISNSAMIGSVTFKDDTYYIEPAHWNSYDNSSSRPLHIIYNNRGVEERLLILGVEKTRAC